MPENAIKITHHSEGPTETHCIPCLIISSIESEWHNDPEFVIVGLRTDFDYEMLKHATFAIRRGAILVATNDDPSYPTDEGILPGSGAIVSAIAVAAGVTPIVGGKPNYPAVDFVNRRFNN